MIIRGWRGITSIGNERRSVDGSHGFVLPNARSARLTARNGVQSFTAYDPPRSRHLPVAVTDGSLTENLNKIGVRPAASARAMWGVRSLPQTPLTLRQLRGTVGYIAPQQVRGLAVNHRADLFAFGAILYNCCRAFARFWSRHGRGVRDDGDPQRRSHASQRGGGADRPCPTSKPHRSNSSLDARPPTARAGCGATENVRRLRGDLIFRLNLRVTNGYLPVCSMSLNPPARQTTVLLSLRFSTVHPLAQA